MTEEIRFPECSWRASHKGCLFQAEWSLHLETVSKDGLQLLSTLPLGGHLMLFIITVTSYPFVTEGLYHSVQKLVSPSCKFPEGSEWGSYLGLKEADQANVTDIFIANGSSLFLLCPMSLEQLVLSIYIRKVGKVPSDLGSHPESLLLCNYYRSFTFTSMDKNQLKI